MVRYGGQIFDGDNHGDGKDLTPLTHRLIASSKAWRVGVLKGTYPTDSLIGRIMHASFFVQ